MIDQIIQKYREDAQRLEDLQEVFRQEAAKIYEFQTKRLNFLLEHPDPAATTFMVEEFISLREAKAKKEREKEEFGAAQAKLETWLLGMLDKIGGEGIRTSFGTVYRTRKEGITVEDFEAYVEAEILTPMALALSELWDYAVDPATILPALKNNAHLEALTKGANKTYVLEKMGEAGKDGGRPNPPPNGVKYVAVATVGVRKK